MSFYQLPDELIAQVASNLNYTDLTSLALSHKRFNWILKSKTLNKGMLFKLDIKIALDQSVPVLSATSVASPEDDGVIEPDVRLSDTDDLEAASLNFIMETIKKYRCIHTLIINNFEINPSLLVAISSSSAKIEFVKFNECKMASPPAEFIQFSQQFRRVLLAAMYLTEEYYSDEVFCELLKNVDVDLCSDYEYDWEEIMYSGAHHLDFRVATEWTDVVLNVMLDGRLPSTFLIDFYEVKFSVEMIHKLIQKALNLNYKKVNWNFGFIGEEEDKIEADEFMERINSDDNTPLKVEYASDNEFEGLKYTVMHNECDQEHFNVVFKYQQKDPELPIFDDDFMAQVVSTMADMFRKFDQLDRQE